MFSAYSGHSRWNEGSSASIPSGSVAIMSMPRPTVPKDWRATYLMPSRRKRRSSLVLGMRYDEVTRVPSSRTYVRTFCASGSNWRS